MINGTLPLVEPGERIHLESLRGGAERAGRGVGNLCLVKARPAGSGILGFAPLLGGSAGEVCFRTPPARHVIANVRVVLKACLLGLGSQDSTYSVRDVAS